MPLWSLWLIAATGLFIVEILTPGAFFFACLGIGALAGALAAFVNLPAALPWIFFLIVSLVSIYSIRPLARRFFTVNQRSSNVDALLGQKAWVTERIAPPELGMVKIVGEIWRAEADETLEKGSCVEIEAVHGTRLKVKKAPCETPDAAQ